MKKSHLVSAAIAVPAKPGSGMYEFRKEFYIDPVKPWRREMRSRTGEADYWNEKQVRDSHDNGRTWSDWRTLPTPVSMRFGEMEVVPTTENVPLWHPVHRHWVHVGTERIFPFDHQEVYRRYWEDGERWMADHTYLVTRREIDGEATRQLVAYEDCPAFDPDRPQAEGYLARSLCRSASNYILLDDGRLLFPANPFVRKCCELLGANVERLFPSCPDLVHGVMIASATYNPMQGRYDITFAPPLVISDLMSSRCLDEPMLATLKSGRILLAMRGSNYRNPRWRTRISASAPPYRYYSLSDDGGRTFSDPVPWHFDTREVLYSPASIAHFIRSTKTGKLYWIGNATGAESYGNDFRHPLCICEVDDDDGVLKKETLAVIDDRRPDESPRLQLSNFGLLEDRETGNFEVTLAKVDQHSAPGTHRWECDSWKYVICPE